MFEERTRKKYLPKFKPPSGCKLSFNEQVKEKVFNAFFYHLRNDGGGIPMQFICTVEDHFFRFTFRETKCRMEDDILILRPIYEGEELDDRALEQYMIDLAREIE